MDLPPSHCSRKEEETGADPAFMLFGKHIKGPLPTKEIKEELSPRGVDERGVSLATSSDEEEEDLNAIEEDPMQMGSAHTSQKHCKAKRICEEESYTSEEMQWQKRKIVVSEGNCLGQQSLAIRQELEKWPNANEGIMCQGTGGIAMGKRTLTEKEVKLEGDMQARKRQAGLWSRCPRCNSTDTKFCYFNNYNVNQPRHFCKHCQRYWTAGGTLRNVPVGAGKRKNKHALRIKDAFSMTPLCESSSLASPEDLVEGTDVKSGLASANAHVPADMGRIRDADCQIPSEQSSMVGRMLPVNTDLVLTVQQSISLPINTSSLAFSNASPPHKPHSLTPLNQLHYMGLPNKSTTKCGKPCSELASKVGPLCPDGLASEDSEARKRNPSNFSKLAANLGDGTARIGTSGSAGLSQMSASEGSEARKSWNPSKFSKMGPNLEGGSARVGASGSAGLSQRIAIWQSGADLRSGSHDTRGYVRSTDNEVPRSNPVNGVAKRAPRVQNGSLQANSDELPSPDQIESASPHHPESGHSPTNPSVHHGLTLTPSFVSPPFTPSRLGKTGEHNLPLWDPNFWPHFYHMYWLDTLAPAHLKPILTPQGWAFPFIPPLSNSTTQSTLGKPEFSHALNTDTISTCTTHTTMSPTPNLLTFNPTPTLKPAVL